MTHLPIAAALAAPLLLPHSLLQLLILLLLILLWHACHSRQRGPHQHALGRLPQQAAHQGSGLVLLNLLRAEGWGFEGGGKGQGQSCHTLVPQQAA